MPLREPRRGRKRNTRFGDTRSIEGWFFSSEVKVNKMKGKKSGFFPPSKFFPFFWRREKKRIWRKWVTKISITYFTKKAGKRVIWWRGGILDESQLVKVSFWPTVWFRNSLKACCYAKVMRVWLVIHVAQSDTEEFSRLSYFQAWNLIRCEMWVFSPKKLQKWGKNSSLLMGKHENLIECACTRQRARHHQI